jgi:hypothetical protein
LNKMLSDPYRRMTEEITVSPDSSDSRRPSSVTRIDLKDLTTLLAGVTVPVNEPAL